MIKFAVYDRKSGVIVSEMMLLHEDEAVMSLGGDIGRLGVVRGEGRVGYQYVKDEEIHDLPPNPGAWATWDLASETWQDRRSEQERADDLAAAKRERIDHVNRMIGHLRQGHITSLPGQEGIYLDKEREARAYLAESPEPANLTDYPFLAAEAGITARTAYELAQVWVNMAAMWRRAGAALEGLRINAIAQIEAAEDEASLDAAVSSFDAAANHT